MVGFAGVRAVAGQEMMPALTPRYGVMELTLTCSERFDNPFREAVCEAEFVSPSGVRTRVEGFYDGDDRWRVRFVPREHGDWTWRGRISGGSKPVDASGAFKCEGTQGHGFLRISKQNPFRYEYEDGTPFYPIGIQTCDFLQPDFDGPEAGKGENRKVSNAEWMQAFTGAVNLVRTQFGQGTAAGCALPLIAARPKKGSGKQTATNFVYQADRYDLALAAKIDEVYRAQREAGLSQILIFLQDMSAWKNEGLGMMTGFGAIRDLAGYKSAKAPNLQVQEQYIRYVIARYGAYVDIWEILNEDSFAPPDYLAHLAGVIRKADPYGRLLTSNFSRPGETWSDITTWHEYMGMPANAVDAYVVSQVALHKSYGKLVQNTEFGNQGCLSNVDPVKWRIAVWAAYMHESGLLFWSMSQSKIPAGHVKSGNANAYIGPDSRQHFRVFHALTRDLPVDLKPVTIGFTTQTDIRAYALCNGKQGLIYIHHFADHHKAFVPKDKLMVQVGPGKWRLRWYHPEDGREVLAEELSTPQQFLFFTMPEATVDLVARLERIGEPDPASGAPEI
jgi:hypothetical protein